jgi:alpha-beta hydrolase superfamily lysophospholipase
MQLKFLLPTLALLSTCSLAQSTAPAKFVLELQGRNIGTADYTFQPSSDGWKLTAHYQFTVPVAVSATRQAAFRKDWEPLAESTGVDVAQTKQSLALTPNKDRTSLNFHAVAGGQDVRKDFPLQPHTVVLANFDPSALQVLLNMHAANPAGGGKYQCFIPSGTGTMLACTLTPSADASAMLNGKPIPLKHWSLALASTTMDVYATADGELMDASVKAQSLDYRRDGLEMHTPPQAAAVPPAGVSEREVTFPSDGLTVPGTLTLVEHPATPTPIAVLVQGSGVQDRDETVGENKVFQQLAWALAQRGVATLRYDRRPKFAMASFLAHPDLDHEVVIDAASALEYCATLPGVDTTHGIFLIGHSLGAQLAPYIVQRADARKPNLVSGYVLLAGVQTPIDQTMVRQIKEFGKAQGATDAQINDSLEKWNKIFADAHNPAVPADKQEGMGTTAGYWRDWLARDPAAVMKTLQVPALVLRGELDRNVTHEDFAALAAAATAAGSEAKEFPGLNHLFMTANGPYADEMKAGSIAPIVLDTISQWVLHTEKRKA